VISAIALLLAWQGAVISGSRPSLRIELASIERESGGFLGVAVINTADGSTVLYRAHQRFPMCSTFKLLAVAEVLARVDVGREHLARHVSFTEADLQKYAPVAQANLKTGFMKVEAMCQAAIEQSDNTAVNLLLRSMGGPKSVTHFCRSMGDEVTRLDRQEPDLNYGFPRDQRDTTTPLAMATDARMLLLRTNLSSASRNLLTGWLLQSTTGAATLRAGLPPDWRVGDKTGSGGATNRNGANNTRNDVAIAWPPGKPPMIVSAYLTGCTLNAAHRDAILAKVARLVSTGTPDAKE
jgi:beta-lactamase class A